MNKYFYLFTLMLVWVLGVYFKGQLQKEPIYSLQLSSMNSTVTGKQYEIQIELLRGQNISVNGKKDSHFLQTKDVINLTVPEEAIGRDPSKADLAKIVAYLNSKQDGEKPLGGWENSVEIVETKDESLLGQTVYMNLTKLLENKIAKKSAGIKIRSVELAEIDDSSEAGVECQDCNKNEILEIYNQVVLGVQPKATKVNSIEDLVKAYSESFWVKRLMAVLKKGFTFPLKNGKLLKVRDGVTSAFKSQCLRATKFQLFRHQLISKYPAEKYARNFGPHLEREGFINLLKTDYKSKIKSPYDAPVGAVLVYGGGPGHTEIRTEKGFISDYFSEKARTGDRLNARGRFLTGVYVKKTPEAEMWLASQKKGSKNAKNI